MVTDTSEQHPLGALGHGSRYSWGTRASQAIRALSNMAGDIKVGLGQVSLGNWLTGAVLAAMVWLGRMVTDDHDKLTTLVANLSSDSTFQQQTVANSNLIAGLQKHQGEQDTRLDETDARLNCLQGVGTRVSGCDTKRRSR